MVKSFKFDDGHRGYLEIANFHSRPSKVLNFENTCILGSYSGKKEITTHRVVQQIIMLLRGFDRNDNQVGQAIDRREPMSGTRPFPTSR